ncbi:MAG: hypothetical protein RIR26_2319 [Pseudomonadota bacterium]
MSLVGKEEFFAHLDALAQKHFAIPELRPLQREVFSALNSNRQVLAMLPTGAGKTLIYALASLFFPDSVTIVVCPLLALMRDQCERMQSAGIRAAMICSEQSDDERRNAFRSLLRAEAKILFISPERFALSGFQKFLSRLTIGMVVIDEAHCVVTWGHTFRPEYSQLSSLIGSLQPKRVLALTATATRASRALIKSMIFDVPDSVFEVVDKPLRDNISVRTIRSFSEDERWKVIENLVLETPAKKSIVYFQRREQCQKAAIEMKKRGIHAVVYHAGLSKEIRKSAEEYLRQSERKLVICATLAFGMGVDLPNVGLVVVAGFPGNIEEMFQMIGRAGRQGERAQAALVWTGSDPKRRHFQFEKMLPESPQFFEMVRPLASFFPGCQQRKIIEKAVLLARSGVSQDSKGSPDQIWSTLAGSLTMLGAGRSLESEHDAWVEIQIPSLESLFNAVADLPSGPSRRRFVLEWIVQRIGTQSEAQSRFSFAFSVGEMAEETQMSWDKISEVLKFYVLKNEISVIYVPRDELSRYFVLQGSFIELEARFPKYHHWRNLLSQGLQALSDFVSTEKCRLNESFKLFESQTARKMSRQTENCGRCDNCLRLERGGRNHVQRQNAGGLTLSLPNRL